MQASHKMYTHTHDLPSITVSLHSHSNTGHSDSRDNLIAELVHVEAAVQGDTLW